MNIIDLLIFGIIAASILVGLYSGLINSLLNSLGLLLSYLFSFLFYGTIARWFHGHEDWVSQMVHYTEGAARIPTLELAHANVSALSQAQIAQTIDQASFPTPFGKLLLSNIQDRVLATSGFSTMADYFNNTIMQVSINLLSFVLLFLLLYVLFSFAISATCYVVKPPVLRHFDWLFGGAVGMARGLLLGMVACTLFPLILAALPSNIPLIDNILQESSLLHFFLDNNPILSGIRGIIS